MPLIKIPISTLRPGMYIVDPGISWLKAPLLYMQEGFLASDEEINGIILQGFAEAYYDPERSRDASFGAPVPHTPLAVELQKANHIYDEAYDNVKNFLESARGGALDLTFARPLVGDIIKSLSRNVDALVTLSLLKKTDEYTYTHSVNVTIFAVAFANFLGMVVGQPVVGGAQRVRAGVGDALPPQIRHKVVYICSEARYFPVLRLGDVPGQHMYLAFIVREVGRDFLADERLRQVGDFQGPVDGVVVRYGYIIHGRGMRAPPARGPDRAYGAHPLFFHH